MNSLLVATFVALASIALAVDDSEIQDLTAYAQHLIDNGALQKTSRVVYHHVPYPVSVPHPSAGPYDSFRHYLELFVRDRQIAKLAKEHELVHQKLNETKEHLETFRVNVSREHELHKEKIAHLNSEIAGHNAEIAALHKVIGNANNIIFTSHRKLLENQKSNNNRSLILARLLSLYQRMHSRMMELHAAVSREHARTLRGLESVAEGFKQKKRLAEERSAKDDEDEKKIVAFKAKKMN